MVINDLIGTRDDFVALCKNHHVKQIYAYDSVNNEVIRAVIKKHLPVLKNEVILKINQ